LQEYTFILIKTEMFLYFTECFCVIINIGLRHNYNNICFRKQQLLWQW